MCEYIINSSEKTQRSATEQETKTMFYLMGYMDDSKKIESFVIDVFNDVTAVNVDGCVFWDSQSKGENISSPSSIGKELVTLFKNYISIFNFDYYILSLRGVSEKNIINSKKPLSNITVLKYDDFVDPARHLIKKSLIEECNNKTYIHIDEFLEKNVDAFLEEVKIVVNNAQNNEYIKKITFMRDELINDDVISDIFEVIRAEQLKIKTNSNINGLKLKIREEALNLKRTFSVKSINSLILGKILGHNIISKNKVSLYCPTHFFDYIVKNRINTKEIDGVVNDATNGIYKMLINENLNKEFWDLIYCIYEENDKCENDVYAIYDDIKKHYSHLLYVNMATEAELIYLIACVLGGKKNES